MCDDFVRIFSVDDMRATISSFFDFDAFARDEIISKYPFLSFVKDHNSPRITELSYTETIQIPNNYKWELPVEIKRLKHLKHIHLNKCNLSGTLRMVCSLRQLVLLRISSNMLQGTIPMEIGSMSDLHFLDISNCNLQGVIPEEIFHLTNCEMMYLHGNKFTSMWSESTTLHLLKRLTINDNMISSFNWSLIPEMVSLELLNAENNSLQSLDAFNSLSLTWLFMKNNPINGKFLFISSSNS